MAKTIAITNQKGGVGKSSSAINIADALKQQGYNVLFIDMDAQHNSTGTYGAKMENEYTIVDVLKKDCTAKEAIQTMPLGDIIPGDSLLAQEEYLFFSKTAREYLLKKQLKEIEDLYDYVIIDTPPNLGIYMINALAASDYCMIPIRAEKYAIEGLGLLISTINEIKENINEDLQLLGVFMSVYDCRNSLDVAIKEQLPIVAKNYGFKMLNSVIRIDQNVKKAQAIESEFDEEGNEIVPNRSLYSNFKNTNAVSDYTALSKEILGVI